jgi:hypothetical protein
MSKIQFVLVFIETKYSATIQGEGTILKLMIFK